MDIEEKRTLVFKQITAYMDSSRSSIVGRVTGERKLPGDGDYFQTVGKLLDSEEAAGAFSQVIYEALEQLAFDVMVMIDEGIHSDTGEFFQLALIDRETKESLAPEELLYHDAFMEFVYQDDEL